MMPREEITTEYAEGEVKMVKEDDGSWLRFRKLSIECHPSNRIQAMTYLAPRQAAGEVVTGLLYLESCAKDLHDAVNIVDAPLNQHGTKDLVPGSAALAAFNAPHR